MSSRRSPRHKTRRALVWVGLAAAGVGAAWGEPTPLSRSRGKATLEQTVSRQLEARLEQRRRVWSREEFSRAVDAIGACCRLYGYRSELILGLIDVESGFKINARSHDGSVGLVQIKPSTARAVCRVRGWTVPPEGSLVDPGINITLGTTYLHYLERTLGSWRMALAGYNMGEVAARRKMEAGLAPRQCYFDEIHRRGALIAEGIPAGHP